MSKSERDALIRHICEHPDDDAPRLVFADWLDEHGDPDRAEFIRTQITLTNDPYTPDRVRLLRRERELLARKAKTWIADDGLTEWVDARYLSHHGYLGRSGRVHRGFVDTVTFQTPDACQSAIANLAARTPLLGVELTSSYTFTPEQQERAMATYHRRYGDRMRRQYGDYVAPTYAPFADADPEYPEPDEFRRFVADPHVSRLRSFRMDTLYIDRRMLGILLTSRLAANLRHLDLSDNIVLWGDDWCPVSESPSLAGLESLTLSGCHLDVAGFAALRQSPHWQNLHTFTMRAGSRQYSGSPVIDAIVAADMPRLTDLEVGEQKGGEAGLSALANWPGLRQLRRLGVAYHFSENGDNANLGVGIQRLLASPHWDELRELDLSETAYRLEHLEIVVSSPNLSTLRVLHLRSQFSSEDEPPLQDEAARMLAACPYLADGVEVHFNRDRLTPTGEAVLRERFGAALVWYAEGRRVEAREP